MLTPRLTDIAVSCGGSELLNTPLLNKGTAFSAQERDTFGLHGLLPTLICTLDEQIERRLKVLRGFGTNFQRYAFLRELLDTNETLFYALTLQHLEEILPLVYTPTVGEACQHFSQIWRRARGIFLSYPDRHRIESILAHSRFDAITTIVVTDGERILGLGDQGAGGMGISIGKLSLYTACAGINPAHTLPIFLDVGTDNEERLADPLYLGWRHPRIRGAEYDVFIETFVEAVRQRWPHVLLQWEDFANANAGRLLNKYRDQLCTFNDDIQGTAAVAAGTLMAALKVTGLPWSEQRIALVGAGAAGCGIASLLLQAMIQAGLSEEEARARFYAVDMHGLLVEGMADLCPAQLPFVQNRAAVANWTRHGSDDHIDLLDVMNNAKPTVLIGVSGQAGAFSEAAIRAMAASVARPVIFPLSNPTSRCEAVPEDLVNNPRS